MWNYEVPWADHATPAFRSETGQWKFSPPVYEQRYMSVISILNDKPWRGQFKKIVDFGCAEMRLLQLLRNCQEVEHILEVDVDGALLEEKKIRAKPLVYEWVAPRPHPLRVEVLQGSITTPDECLRNTDLVIAVELLEHLYDFELVNVPENVFGFIQPKMAIFTTPNIEANVLFDSLLPNGFRHDDHKFEWNRLEFREWALNVVSRYTNYKVTFTGVGLLPPDYQHLGPVSQIAIFVRNDLIGGEIKPTDYKEANTDATLGYKTIYAVDFPYRIDDRPRQQKILDELVYHIKTTCGNVDHEYCEVEELICPIDLGYLVSTVSKLDATEDEVRDILLTNGYNIVDDKVLAERDDIYRDCSESELDYCDEMSQQFDRLEVDVDEECWD